MGGGDLNAKKSWHVSLLSNQKKVWEQEQAALAERKRTQERLEELRKERQAEETQQQLEAAGGRKRVDRVEWMYQGPTDGNGGLPSEESEAFLLGKRRIDSILKGDENKKLQKTAAGAEAGFTAAGGTANTPRDMASKLREDPLVAIKRQEQANYEALMNDPVKRRQLLRSMGMLEGDKEKDGKERHRKRRHHHRRRHDDDNSEDERRHKRRRSSSRDRSRSPRRYDSEEEDRYRSRRRDSRERRRSDPGEARRSHHHRPSRRDERDDRRSRSRSRSTSPRRGRREGDRDSSPLRDRPRNGDDTSRNRAGSRNGHWSRDGDKPRDGYRPRDGGVSQNGGNKDDDRARRLAAMQEAAADLDQDRERRLQELEKRERAARDVDDRARERDARYGGRAFTNNLHKRAGDAALAERVGGRR